MLNKEREERRKRKDSLTQEVTTEPVADEDEFSKPMMYLFDDAELQERKKE